MEMQRDFRNRQVLDEGTRLPNGTGEERGCSRNKEKKVRAPQA